MALTLAEARARAAVVTDVSYEVVLDLTSAEDFASRTVVWFAVSAPETFLELADARELRVTVDGMPVEPSYDGDRIPLTGLATGRPVELVVEARLPYVTDGNGLHTYTDPVDGERYVSAYCGMNMAHRVLACFDQNDLKAPVTLSVRTDPAWTVLANGEVAEVQVADGVQTTVFARTPPLPVPLFVVCARPWASHRWEHAGRTLGWHARASLADELARDVDELRGTTEACFEHYAGIFEEPVVASTVVSRLFHAVRVALAGETESFPLLYHWRILPGRPPIAAEHAETDTAVAALGGSPAVRARLQALAPAPCSLVLFCEYIPYPMQPSAVTGRHHAAARTTDHPRAVSTARTSCSSRQPTSTTWIPGRLNRASTRAQ